MATSTSKDQLEKIFPKHDMGSWIRWSLYAWTQWIVASLVAVWLKWRPLMCEWVLCYLVMMIEGHSMRILGQSASPFFHDMMVPLCVVMSCGMLPRLLRVHGAYPGTDSAWARFASWGAAT